MGKRSVQADGSIEVEGKRGNGEGSIFKRKDGRYTASVVMGDGRRKDFYGRTRDEVARKLTDALKAKKEGLPIPGDRLTVEKYLADWLVSVKPTLKPRTFDRYCGLLKLHATPFIGRIALTKLTPLEVRKLYAARQEAGLSPTTVRQLHAILHHAFEQAARDGLVGRSVIDLVSPPRAAEHEMRCLDSEQARALLAEAHGDRLEALYVLALSTGMRQGELLALRWRDVDLEGARVQVRGSLQRTKDGFRIESPKTTGSRRSVALTPAAVDALRRHRAAQNAERLRVGALWDDQDLVFATERGTPIERGNLTRRSFEPLLKKAGLPRIRFHDLRHTAATLMLSRGVHPKIAADMLGHSTVAVTLNVYSHVTPRMQQAAVDAIAAALGG